MRFPEELAGLTGVPVFIVYRLCLLGIAARIERR
jgi:hypothetical protein